MAGEYQGAWAQALNKLQDDELYKLANDFIRQKDIAQKNALAFDRVKLDGDIKDAITFGGNYDQLIDQVGKHQQINNDNAWSMQQINKLQSAKRAEMGLNNALDNLTRLSGEIQKLNPESSTSGGEVDAIMNDVHKYLSNLKKMKNHQLAAMHQKGIAEDVKLFQTLQAMQAWDTSRGEGGQPGIQIAPDDPARVAKERAIAAGKMRNLTEVQKSMLDVPGQQQGDPQRFTYDGMDWTKAPQGYQNTAQGKADREANPPNLREYDKGSGKWYKVNAIGSGTSSQQKLSKEQNTEYDKAIGSMVREIQSAHGLEELSDKFKADAVGHPLKSPVSGDYSSDDRRRTLKKNLAATIDMWFTGRTMEGKSAKHNVEQPWIGATMEKAKRQGLNREEQIQKVMQEPQWAQVMKEGNPGLKDLFDWSGTGSSEEAGNQYFLKTIALYNYLNDVTGKKGAKLSLLEGQLTVQEEREIEEMRKLLGE